MDIKQLKRFLDLCETGNFTKTAENLFLSQQALSSSMIALEEELGRSLFRRTPKGVVLTEAGTLLKELCLPVVERFDSMTQELDRRFQLKKAVLPLALAPVVLQASAPDLLLRFRMAYPNVDLKAVEERDTVCLEHLAKGTVDMAFCPRPLDCSGLEYIPLGQERLCAVVNIDSPLAGRRTLRMADLKDEKLVSLNKYHCIYYKILDGFSRCGCAPDFVVETGEIDVLLSMVKLNMCVFICMEYAAKDMDRNNCVKIPISDPGMAWEYGLMYRKGRRLEYGAEKLMEFAQKALGINT